jgi:hypothetical protein
MGQVGMHNLRPIDAEPLDENPPPSCIDPRFAHVQRKQLHTRPREFLIDQGSYPVGQVLRAGNIPGQRYQRDSPTTLRQALRKQ